MTEANTKSIFLPDEAAQVSLAADVGKQLKSSFIMLLKGDLGAGKTTFARGFIHASGFDGVVKSPTYTLVEPYSFDTGLVCYHFDLYRLADPEELEFTGARDYFNDSSICLIEWPEKAAGHLADADIDCVLEHHPLGRKITLSACSAKGKQLMLQVQPD